MSVSWRFDHDLALFLDGSFVQGGCFARLFKLILIASFTDGLPLVHVIKNLHWFSLYLCYERYSFCFSESKLHRFCAQTSEQRSSQRAGRSATRFDLFCFVVKHKPIVEIVYLNHENRTTPTLKSSIAIYCY